MLMCLFSPAVPNGLGRPITVVKQLERLNLKQLERAG